jgi:hypothetical protein
VLPTLIPGRVALYCRREKVDPCTRVDGSLAQPARSDRELKARATARFERAAVKDTHMLELCLLSRRDARVASRLPGRCRAERVDQACNRSNRHRAMVPRGQEPPQGQNHIPSSKSTTDLQIGPCKQRNAATLCRSATRQGTALGTPCRSRPEGTARLQRDEQTSWHSFAASPGAPDPVPPSSEPSGPAVEPGRQPCRLRDRSAQFVKVPISRRPATWLRCRRWPLARTSRSDQKPSTPPTRCRSGFPRAPSQHRAF